MTQKLVRCGSRCKNPQSSARSSRSPLRLDGLIAFEHVALQPFEIGDFDMAAAVADDASRLQRMRDDRDRVALHADDLRQLFLSQRQAFATAQIARPQQPARQPRFDRVGRVACDRLLRGWANTACSCRARASSERWRCGRQQRGNPQCRARTLFPAARPRRRSAIYRRQVRPQRRIHLVAADRRGLHRLSLGQPDQQ